MMECDMDLTMIPETVEEALAKWDANETVFTVEMGGLGPGYEMAIQGLAFEIMREMQSIDDWEKIDWEKYQEGCLDPLVSRLDKEPWGGFSGAQVGAATNLAAQVSKKGYRNALAEVPDRHIQVSKLDLRGSNA